MKQDECLMELMKDTDRSTGEKGLPGTLSQGWNIIYNH